MSDEERVTNTLLHLRCAQAGISERKVSSTYDYLLPRLEKAETALQKQKNSLEEMYYAFDAAEIKATGDPECVHLYPHTSSGMAAWSGMYGRMLSSQTSKLTDVERLSLKMVNYMAYTECVYANIVNQLCYVLANTNSSHCMKKLDCKKSMESIARDCMLKHKINFLKCNLQDMPDSVPDITEACNIHLRNMIAHGSLAGSLPPAPRNNRQKSKYHDMAEPVYVRRRCGKKWKWDEKPTDLDAECEKMCNVTLTWQTALLHYQDVRYE